MAAVMAFMIASCNSENVPESRGAVHVKKNGKEFQLIRNGKPFFIQGVSGHSQLKELAEIGGNTIRVYDTTGLASILTEAEKHHLAVIVDLPIPRFDKTNSFYNNNKDAEQLIKKIGEFVSRHKNHPALLIWNIGNEIEFPLTFYNNTFIKTFNKIIDIIHKEDPDHPVSTAIPSVSKKQILGIYLRSSKIDLLGINIFGNLHNLEKDLSKIYLGAGHHFPYYLSEWGWEGPWEANNTSWKAPLELTSTQKGNELKSRYQNILQKKDKQCVGSLAFYWGNKQERTHTWFSFFGDDGSKSEMIGNLKEAWDTTAICERDIVINEIQIDKRKAEQSIVLTPNDIRTVEITFKDSLPNSYNIEWEIYAEGWNYNMWDNKKRPPKIDKCIVEALGNSMIFKTPSEEGPYRIFARVFNQNGSFATANFPFYVLNNTVR